MTVTTDLLAGGAAYSDTGPPPWEAVGDAIDSPTYTIGDWAGNVVDNYGVEWIVEKESGWSGSPDQRRTSQDKDRQDGSYYGAGYFGSRLIQLAGKALCPSRGAMVAAKRRFAALLSGRDMGLLVVEEADMTLQALVTRAAENGTDDKTTRVFEWSLQLQAPDPRKYACYTLTQDVALPVSGGTLGRTYPRTYPMRYAPVPYIGRGRMAVVNPGTYEVGALLTITGPNANASVTHVESGFVLSASRALAPGETIALDLLNHRVFLNGQLFRGNILSDRGWFLLEKGRNTLQYGGTSSANTELQCTFRPAYI